jgi:fatty-acyl-CoA synthase
MEPDMNWFAVLDHHATRTPHAPMTVFGGETLSYGQMADRVARLAGGLRAQGVGPGHVVGLLSYNCPEFLETLFAANHLGAVAMPINWRLAAPEVRYILEHSEARALVCDEALLSLGAEAAAGLEATLLRVVISPGSPDTSDPPTGGSNGPAGWIGLGELRASAGPAVPHPVAGDDVHRLMYTSGTTGRPKGVMLTHANLAWKNLAHIIEFGFTRAEVGLACGPLYHVGALDLTTT